jgi:hypothetical protein
MRIAFSRLAEKAGPVCGHDMGGRYSRRDCRSGLSGAPALPVPDPIVSVKPAAFLVPTLAERQWPFCFNIRAVAHHIPPYMSAAKVVAVPQPQCYCSRKGSQGGR